MKINVQLIDVLGTDLTICNAARVSMAKESEWEVKAGFRKQDLGILADRDIKLIQYLAKHNHWSPFSHPQLSFRISAPIFVARQWFKHMIGITRNETSRRYVDEEPTFYMPAMWRKRADNVKQGSKNEEVDHAHIINEVIASYNRSSAQVYQHLLEDGVAPEQARMVLPQSMMTEWIETGSLAAFARACKLRLDPHAQVEVRELAEPMAEIIKPLFPHSWSALVGEV
jgi:thymidylate synthase (FAD)